jgi:hypothetical protein
VRLNRKTVFLGILLVGLFVAALTQGRIAALRAALGAEQTKLALLISRTADLKKEIGLTRAAIEAESRPHALALAAIQRERAAIAEKNPDSRWAEPPAHLPAWDEQSPYVWLSKETLQRLPVVPFSKEGKLDAQLAAVLAVDDKGREQLNRKLRDVVGRYRELEAAAAQPTTNHLPGISETKGAKATIVIKPIAEESSRLKEQFMASLKSELGAGRGALVADLARGWLAENMDADGKEPKTISAARHPDGSLSITIRSGSQWMSVGGPSNLEQYVPPHLLPFFAALQTPAEPGAAVSEIPDQQ